MATDKNLIEQEAALACDLTAIPATQGKQHSGAAERLFAAVQEVRELPDGYALCLSEERVTLQEIAAFITNERLCCPFFHFTLSIEPQGVAVWLHLTGGEGVKAV